MTLRTLITIFALALVLQASANPQWRDSGGFVRSGGGGLHNGEARGQLLEFTPAPDGKPGSRLTWDFSRYTFAEINLPSPIPLEPFRELEVTLDYHSEGLRQLTSCGMRIIDASGEVFQWSIPANDNLSGWKTVRYHITPDNANGSWGGNQNKEIEFPARLIGFAAGFARESTGPVWFGNLRYRLPGEKVKIPALDYRWNFDERAEWWRSWGITRMVNQEIVSTRRGDIHMNERMFAVRKVESGKELRLYSSLENGAAKLSIYVYDGKGKRQELPPVALNPGKNCAVYSLTGLAFPLRIDMVRVNGQSDEFKLRMERLELWDDKEAAAAVNVAVETGHPLRLMLPGAGRAAMLRLTNRTEQPLALDGEFTVSDYFGERSRFERKIELAAGGQMQIPVDTSDFPHDGIYYIHYRFRNRNAKESDGVSGKISFARMTPAGPTPEPATGFLFSICTHTERWGLRDQELEVLACALAGAKVIRTSPGWGQIQPKKDVWDYELFDRMIKMYADSGMELQVGFGLGTHWGKADDARLRDGNPDTMTNGRSMPDLELWRAYVRNTVTRYRGKIRYWEVWNEPDLTHFANFGVDDFVRLLGASYEEAKKADPEAFVMNGGFAGLTAPEQIAYQRRFLETAQGKFDIHAFHQHGDFGVFRQVIDGVFLPQRQETGTTAPWYANETALHSLGDQEHLQAETLFTKLIFAWSRGAIGYTWYDLRNDGFSATDAEHNYGMVTNDFHPKAVYPAFAALVNIYRNMNFDREVELTPGEYAYLFRGEDSLALAAWREVSAADTTSGLYAGTTDGKHVRRVDIMGNSTQIPLENGRFLFQPGRIPETLIVEGGTKLTFESILKAGPVGPVAEGREMTLEFELSGDTELLLNCELAAEAPFHIAEKNFKLKAIPGARNTVRKPLSVGKGLGSSVRRIPLHITIPGGGSAEIAIPVYPATRLSPALSDRPDFVLDRRIQVSSLYDKVPGRSIWQGPQDLSAGIFCGVEHHEFVIRAEVTDDIHRQNDSGAQIWRGDSVQLYFYLPGQEGSWEIGGALLNSGKSDTWVWSVPVGFDPKKARSRIKTQIKRSGTRTDYEFRIPLDAIGLTSQLLKEGFRFNLLVNDSDVPGDEREGWIRIAPGAGDERKPLRYPVIFFE